MHAIYCFRSLANTDIYDNYVDPTAPFFIDESFQMLTRKQRRLVTKNPGTMLAVGQGANMAVAECQHQFSNRKWDCPINQSNGGTIFGKITRHGKSNCLKNIVDFTLSLLQTTRLNEVEERLVTQSTSLDAVLQHLDILYFNDNDNDNNTLSPN